MTVRALLPVLSGYCAGHCIATVATLCAPLYAGTVLDCQTVPALEQPSPMGRTAARWGGAGHAPYVVFILIDGQDPAELVKHAPRATRSDASKRGRLARGQRLTVRQWPHNAGNSFSCDGLTVWHSVIVTLGRPAEKLST